MIKVILEKISTEGEEEIQTVYFHSETYEQFTTDTITENLDRAHLKIINSFEKFLQKGSGWRLKHIEYFELKIGTYLPLKGSSYLPLPQELAKKGAILNIENFNDQKCFLWSVLAHLHKIDSHENANRVSKYSPFENTLKMKGISYPVPYRKVSAIENMNNLRINVYGHEEGEVCILYVSPKTNEDVINLLLISDGENTHYSLIRNFS